MYSVNSVATESGNNKWSFVNSIQCNLINELTTQTVIYIVRIEKESKESLSIFHKKLLKILPMQETHLFPVN